MTTNPQTEQTSDNLASELHYYYMWSQDNLATLIDATRPKVKKMISGEVEPNDLQAVLLKEVLRNGLTYKKYIEIASRHYRLKLIRESEDE